MSATEVPAVTRLPISHAPKTFLAEDFPMTARTHLMKTLFAILALAGLIPAFLPAEEGIPSQADVTVHEWGTFTSVAGQNGLSLEWRPLAETSDLPSFVYSFSGAPRGLRHGSRCRKCNHFYCVQQKIGNQLYCTKASLSATVRMETPVLYFYAEKETLVSVKVNFPKGQITEWYPQARDVAGGIDWGWLTVQPGALENFPVEKGKSHYYSARKTDAARVRIGTTQGRKTPVRHEHEKFLFYRGVGSIELPLSIQWKGDKLLVKNLGNEEIPEVFLFENRTGRDVGYIVHNRRLKQDILLDRPTPMKSMEALLQSLEKSLVAHGLFEKEAKAMIETWRDSWFERGLRLFYVLPRKITDEILPLTIEPKPKEVVRVMVGRLEIFTPETKAEIMEMVQATRSDSASKSNTLIAKQLERRYGRFAEPALKQFLLQTEEPGLRARIQDILNLR